MLQKLWQYTKFDLTVRRRLTLYMVWSAHVYLHVVSCQAGNAPSVRNSLVNKVKFLGPIPKKWQRPMRLRRIKLCTWTTHSVSFQQWVVNLPPSFPLLMVQKSSYSFSFSFVPKESLWTRLGSGVTSMVMWPSYDTPTQYVIIMWPHHDTPTWFDLPDTRVTLVRTQHLEKRWSHETL